MEKQLYENKKQKQTKKLTLQTRLIFKHDKQYTNKIKYNTTPINSNKHTGTAKSLKIL